MVFTSGDRVLLHLLLKGNREDSIGGVADQDDIAAFCGIGRTHVPRALKPLISDDLVNESQGRAPGRTRRVKVYCLTEKGILAAVSLRDRANETILKWTDETGEVHSEHCVDALRRINDQLGARGMNQIPISLFLTIGREKVGWNDILFLSSSVRREKAGSIHLPEGWAPATSPVAPDILFDREGDIKELDTLVGGHNTSAVAGEPGIGKRTLVSAWARRSGKKVLWLKQGEEGEYCIDADRYDVLVILEAKMVDVASTLVSGGGVRLMDPRGEDWPDILRELPLIGILNGSIANEGIGLMELKGIDEAIFSKEAERSGLPKQLVEPYLKATKGSPMAVEYLKEMDSSILGKLGSLDEEAAIMSLVLGFRSRL